MKEAPGRHLFLDARIVDETRNLKLEVGHAEKCDHNPLFGEDYFADPSKEWEARYDNLYPNVILDTEEGCYKLWYNVFIRAKQSEDTPLRQRSSTEYHGGKVEDGLLYAVSQDGVSWAKPNLGLISFDGSMDNNIVMDANSHGIHGVGIFKDLDDADYRKRYKAFFRESRVRRMAVAYSEDGLHWSEPLPWPEFEAVGDTHNNAIRMSDGSYVGISRGWTGSEEEGGVRTVLRTESPDFVNWSDPVNVLQGKDAHDQIYSMPVFRHGSIYLGLPAIFHKGERDAPDWDTVDTELAWSPDTISWNRVCPGQPLIRRGEGTYPDGEYDCGCIYAAMPVNIADAHLIYYGGSNGRHNDFREGSFCLATLHRDRFAGYAAGNAPGYLTTSPFELDGDQITVNIDIDPGGRARAGILTAGGEGISGFGLDDCRPVAEDGLDVELTWSKSVRELAGRRLRLVVALTHATLYALGGDLRFES